MHKTATFHLRMPEFLDLVDPSQQDISIEVNINGDVYNCDYHYLKKISTKVSKLSSDKALIISTDALKIPSDLARRFTLMLKGLKKIEFSVEELPLFAELYKAFEINGEILVEDQKLTDQIENSLSELMKENNWQMMIEFASKLEFNNLFVNVVKFISQFEFSLIKKLEQRLAISSSYLKKFVETHNAMKIKQSNDGMIFLTFSELRSFMRLQLSAETDLLLKSELEEELIEKCFDCYGDEAAQKLLNLMEESIENDFKTHQNISHALEELIVKQRDFIRRGRQVGIC